MPIVTLTTSGKSIEVDRDTNLLRMSIRHEGSVPYKCGGGLCGTCKVKIINGRENLSKVMKKEINKLGQDKINQGYRLACQTFVTGDISVEWGEKDVERLNKIAERRINSAQ